MFFTYKVGEAYLNNTNLFGLGTDPKSTNCYQFTVEKLGTCIKALKKWAYSLMQ